LRSWRSLRSCFTRKPIRPVLGHLLPPERRVHPRLPIARVVVGIVDRWVYRFGTGAPQPSNGGACYTLIPLKVGVGIATLVLTLDAEAGANPAVLDANAIGSRETILPIGTRIPRNSLKVGVRIAPLILTPDAEAGAIPVVEDANTIGSRIPGSSLKVGVHEVSLVLALDAEAGLIPIIEDANTRITMYSIIALQALLTRIALKVGVGILNLIFTLNAKASVIPAVEDANPLFSLLAFGPYGSFRTHWTWCTASSV
jgi:hypothetical protein